MTTPTYHPIKRLADDMLALLRLVGTDVGHFDMHGFVEALLAEYQAIAPIWSIDDVKEERPDLSDDDAWEVLEHVGRKHDAEWGISWTTLKVTADDLFPRRGKAGSKGGRP